MFRNIVKQNFKLKKISETYKTPFKNRKFLAISRNLLSIFHAWRLTDNRNQGIVDL